MPVEEVALPLKTSPAVAFGRVLGFCCRVANAVPAMPHQRLVTWIDDGLPRVAIDQDLRHSFGASMTVCRIQRNDAEARIKALVDTSHS